MNALSRYAWRETRRRPGRAALAFLGVVLGVASMVAISISTRAAKDAYRTMYASLGGRATLEVVAEGLGGFDAEVGEALARVPGIGAVVPVVLGHAALVSPGPRGPVLVLGIDASRDRAARDVTVVEGAPLGAPDVAHVLASFARTQGVRVGTRVRLVTPSGLVDVPVAGLVESAALSAAGGGGLLLALPTAQRWFGLAGRWNAAQLVPEAGADESVVIAAVRAALPPGLRVQRAVARAAIAESSLRSAEQGLSAVSLMSLVAAVFVIWNAFSMNLAERRRSLATVRALGATQRQVARALLAEAALLGVGGAVAGVLAGIAGSRLLALGIQAMLGAALPPPEVAAGPLVLAFVLGPATTLLATIAPARRAARRDPLGDLLGAPETSSARARHGTGALGVVLIALALGMSLGFRAGVLGPAFIAPGMALGLLGAALAFPLLLPLLRRVVVRLLAPLVGPAGRLGLRQVVARPLHTTLSSTVLFLAVAAGVGMGNEILGGVEDVRDWSRRTLVHDWIVRATMPESGTLIAAPIPEALGDEIRRMEAVAHVDEMRFVPAMAGDVPVIVLARTFEAGRPLRLDFHRTLGGTTPTALGPGEAIVGTALAGRLRLEPGGELTLSTRAGPRTFRVIATSTEYTAGGQAVYVSLPTAVEAFGAGGADAFMIRAKPGLREQAGREIGVLTGREHLLLQSHGEFQALVDGKVNGLVALLWTSLAAVFVVASLGVVNTLTMNVLEQTRHIGVLRAVAMTRGQVRTMVLAQALAMASMALLPGAIVGTGISLLMNSAVGPLRGFPVEFRLVPGLVLGCVGVALVIAVVAGLVPAWRAARLPVVTALPRD